MPIRMSFEMTTFEIELLGTENLILTHVFMAKQRLKQA
ncbi:hypothetical protein VTP01DRAFT_7281 [Rhizomucor pusillus]